MIHSIHHVALSTPDLDRAVAFYCNLFGATNISGELGWEKGSGVADDLIQLDSTAARFSILKIGETFLELYEFQNPRPNLETGHRVCDPGLNHIAFHVDDCRNEYARLKASGMHFQREPTDIGEGTIFTFGRDPDGNIIEIIEIPEGASYGSGPDAEKIK